VIPGTFLDIGQLKEFPPRMRVAKALRWLPVVLKIVDPVIALLAILKATSASWRSMAIRPTIALRIPKVETRVHFWRAAGHTVDVGSTSCTSKIATATIEKMATLWAIEDTVRGQSPKHRVAARKQASAAVNAG
jgi:hypothetical protein